MENFTTLVSSRGLLKSCDCHNAKPVSSSDAIDEDILTGHFPGGSIYVCTDALPRFCQQFLPQIRHPFTLVSGDSDFPITAECIRRADIASLLQSPYLMGWHAQNLAATHDKLHHLPIGQDYHTMWERPRLWGLSQISPCAQEQQLLGHFRQSIPVEQRYFNLYCNWHFAIHRGDRQECFNEVPQDLCFFEPNAVGRSATWGRQSEFMFVLSPEGAGMDCHRTWEALALGCIPVVKKNPLSALFKGLPILEVDRWSDVKRDTLLQAAQSFVGREFDYSKMFLGHWIARIRGSRKVDTYAAKLTPAAFRSMMNKTTC